MYIFSALALASTESFFPKNDIENSEMENVNFKEGNLIINETDNMMDIILKALCTRSKFHDLNLISSLDCIIKLPKVGVHRASRGMSCNCPVEKQQEGVKIISNLAKHGIFDHKIKAMQISFDDLGNFNCSSESKQLYINHIVKLAEAVDRLKMSNYVENLHGVDLLHKTLSIFDQNRNRFCDLGF